MSIVPPETLNCTSERLALYARTVRLRLQDKPEFTPEQFMDMLDHIEREVAQVRALEIEVRDLTIMVGRLGNLPPEPPKSEIGNVIYPGQFHKPP
ncbi:MAG: hypothetical protein AAF903_12130 [Pseudomonadota bacterium]